MPWVQAYEGENCDGCEKDFAQGEQVYRKKDACKVTVGTFCEECIDKEADAQAAEAEAKDGRYSDEPARTDDD
jgi:hypothetical protein